MHTVKRREDMKVIFLDIDGVLNKRFSKTHAPSGCNGIENALLKRLTKIIEETDARVVLSSTWKSEIDKNLRYMTGDGKYMLNKFKYEGKFHLFDKTPDASSCMMRGTEIDEWLSKRDDIESFVILDDVDFDDFSIYGYGDKLVLTDPKIGLTDADVALAIEILNR